MNDFNIRSVRYIFFLIARERFQVHYFRIEFFIITSFNRAFKINVRM
jgi:hypothetical protein